MKTSWQAQPQHHHQQRIQSSGRNVGYENGSLFRLQIMMKKGYLLDIMKEGLSIKVKTLKKEGDFQETRRENIQFRTTIRNGILSKEKDHPPEEFNAYNRLLREGRLAESVDLLENMERRGLLDMSKVYHAKFFKPIKEAFHFCKLVQIPSLSTFNMLISMCASSQDSEGQVAKAFGSNGIMSSKNVKPDRVVFNGVIAACGQSGALYCAFGVSAEMMAEAQPIDPDHITVGALLKACANAGQVDRAQELYNMVHEYNIKGTPEVYTIAVNGCSQTSDWESACRVYDDKARKGVVPSEAKTWQKGLELYGDIKSMKLKPTVTYLDLMLNDINGSSAYAKCFAVKCEKTWGYFAAGDVDQLPKALEALSEMKIWGLCPNTITYSILSVASKRKDDLVVGHMLLFQAIKDCAAPTLIMCKCIIGRPGLTGLLRNNCSWCHCCHQDALISVLWWMDLENTILSALSLLEEAASLGIIPCVSFKESPIVVDAKKLQIHIAESTIHRLQVSKSNVLFAS
ncbi:unnamed protein product [Dovyalis caffra]|uniref:Pentatricopeptide repeat-containing protein n=1 Tax=Dovyalis caffra TaxID=77055 RepID=A0AAV1SKN0_9ROSI|nr:unnamed protein product [Dovyalis caffra]